MTCPNTQLPVSSRWRKNGAVSKTMMSAIAKCKISRQVTVRFFIRHNIVQMIKALPGNPRIKAIDRMAIPRLAEDPDDVGIFEELVKFGVFMVITAITVLCKKKVRNIKT